MFEDGEIIETGTHDQLLAKTDGKYREFYMASIGHEDDEENESDDGEDLREEDANDNEDADENENEDEDEDKKEEEEDDDWEDEDDTEEQESAEVDMHAIKPKLLESLQTRVDDEDSLASPLVTAGSISSSSLSNADDEASSDDRTAWEDEDEDKGDDEDAGATCDKMTVESAELPLSDKDASVSQIGDEAAGSRCAPTPQDDELSAPVDLDEPTLDNDSGFEGDSCDEDEDEDQGSARSEAGSAMNQDR